MLPTENRIYAGNSNLPLARKIAKYLSKRLASAVVEKFNDSEIRIEINRSVRGTTAFLLQSTSFPVNDNLMELLLMSDAMKRAGCSRVVACVPYFGYSRQDRKPGYSRVPISAKLVANMMTTAGIDHLITMDLHATQIQGFFDIPVDNISAAQLFITDIYKKHDLDNIVIVSPDVGGVARARGIAKQLSNSDLAIIDKRRPKAGKVEIMNVIGDIESKTCIMVDDIADTCNTLVRGVDALMEKGAKEVVAYITHGVLSGSAIDNLENSKIKELVITDSIDITAEQKKSKKIRQISIAELMGETISNIANNKSVSTILE